MNIGTGGLNPQPPHQFKPWGVASGWDLVLTGVPQGLVLRPVLFIMFIVIDDIEDGISSTVLKFADDTKLVPRLDRKRTGRG